MARSIINCSSWQDVIKWCRRWCCNNVSSFNCDEDLETSLFDQNCRLCPFFYSIVYRPCTLRHGSWTIICCLCCSRWWVLEWTGERILTNGLRPTTWQWWMLLKALDVVLGLPGCSWRTGGLKWAELHSKHALSRRRLFFPFFPQPCVWHAGKHGNQSGYLHMTDGRIAAWCQPKGNFIIIRAQVVLWRHVRWI